MRFLPASVALIFSLTMAANVQADIILIEFNSQPFEFPYTEDGFTITVEDGGSAFFAGNGTDRTLNPALTEFVRFTGPSNFTLNSFDVASAEAGWTLRASNGTTYSLPTVAGTQDLTGLGGWSDIVYFDLLHTTDTSHRLRVDNFEVNTSAVPEPHFFGILAAACATLGFAYYRKEKRKRLARC